jgi:hypothetical protein
VEQFSSIKVHELQLNLDLDGKHILDDADLATLFYLVKYQSTICDAKFFYATVNNLNVDRTTNKN